MNFYQIHNLEQKEHFSTGLNIDLMSKLFKDIGAKSELKTVNDIAKYSIVVLEKGTFSLTNEHLIYVGEIKNVECIANIMFHKTRYISFIRSRNSITDW